MNVYEFDEGILKSGHESYKLIKLLRCSLIIIMFSQVILN